jgi:7-keto-8-aminopelargonate synthetase-like enzyme
VTSVDEQLDAIAEVVSDGVRRGMVHNVAEDERLDGRTVTVHGQRLVNFGSCSYLGLETHSAIKAGVVAAVERFGSQFSSSRAYLSAPGYTEAEPLLGQLFGRPTLVTPSTTTGHLAALPTLLGSKDALILDHQVHHSVQLAAKIVQTQGTTVELLPHSNLDRLERRIEELSRTHRRIWYAADGLYSMYADFAPIDGLNELAERYPSLWLYLDDAHAVSWTGRHGRGYSLEHLSAEARSRSVVAASLNKSFAAAGGAITFPSAELRERVFSVGGPLIFSGPVQPPMLGAIIASAKLHLSDAVAPRRSRLTQLIRLFNARATERGLPLVSPSEAPIRCVGAGVPDIAYRLTGALREAGFFVDTASFPAVPAKRSGVRITLTAHHTERDVTDLVDALADAMPGVLAEGGSSMERVSRTFSRQLGGRALSAAPAEPAQLVLEHHRSVAAIDPAEWDRMLGDRGTFGWQALRTLEEAFDGTGGKPEDRWDFHYWLVREAAGGAPVAATFFTAARWKDDALSSVEVSTEVERRRRDDPYYLTSTVLAMGTPLTEGDHLYLDRTRDWRAALRLILAAARDEEDRCGASAVIVRDLPDGDAELHEFLVGEGLLRTPQRDSWVREVDFGTDEEFLAGLAKKARYHQRTTVLGWEGRYRVEVLRGGTPEAAAADTALRDHLYALYRRVHARNLELNVFPLPRRVIDAVLARPGWELTLLYLVDGPALPVAFGLQHVAPSHVQPVFVGLDYDYVASHHAYQQTLWQAVRAAQRNGAGRVLFGMSADLQKARFGARPERRWLYVQPTDSYQADVLGKLTEAVAAAGRASTDHPRRVLVAT